MKPFIIAWSRAVPPPHRFARTMPTAYAVRLLTSRRTWLLSLAAQRSQDCTSLIKNERPEGAAFETKARKSLKFRCPRCGERPFGPLPNYTQRMTVRDCDGWSRTFAA